MQEINLKINVDEANLLLEALGNLPFNKVYQLIGKIQNQAAAQIQTNGQEKTEAPISEKTENG